MWYQFQAGASRDLACFLSLSLSLSLSQTPAQPQVQSSLLADETPMDQSAPLSQPTANHDLKAEPPS